jgi:hypothetical protein
MSEFFGLLIILFFIGIFVGPFIWYSASGRDAARMRRKRDADIDLAIRLDLSDRLAADRIARKIMNEYEN